MEPKKMTLEQARKKAVSLWGASAFAKRDRTWDYRYCVGASKPCIVGRDAKKGYLGRGDSYEEAFEQAAAKLATFKGV